MDSIPPQDPRPGTIKKAVSWEVDSPHRVLVNATPSDSSPSTSPRQREETQEESYMDALLADTQPPLDGLSTVIDRPSSPTTCPETQKARLSMENNARLLNQDLSNDDIAFFPHFQPEDSSLPSRAPGYKQFHSQRSQHSHRGSIINILRPSRHYRCTRGSPGGVPDPEIPCHLMAPSQWLSRTMLRTNPFRTSSRTTSPSISHNAPDGVIPLQNLAFDRANQTTHLEDTRQLNSDHYSLPLLAKPRDLWPWPSQIAVSYLSPPLNADPIPDSVSPEAAQIIPTEAITAIVTLLSSQQDSPLDTTARIDESLSITEVSASREVTRRAEAAINDGPRHEESDTSRQLDDSLESRQNLSVISNQSSAPPDLQASSQHHTNSDENNITGQMFQSEQSDIDGHLGDEQTTSISLPPLRPTDSEVSQSIMDDSSRTVEPTDGAIEAQVDATDVIPPALADIHSSQWLSCQTRTTTWGFQSRWKSINTTLQGGNTTNPLSSRGEAAFSFKAKRERDHATTEDEPNTVQREENSSSLARQQSSGEMTTSSPAVPATSSRTSSQSSTSVRLNKRQTQARQSSAVSVVVPRFRKSKAPLPSRTKAPLHQQYPRMMESSSLAGPESIAYRTDWERLLWRSVLRYTGQTDHKI
ncbi:hypothetical protein KEM48_000627 [Puccinia striiformis f. sp. tritici PST-130]|nr:hypothetical protein KEM48_000627 [Puccinia striiformis f. sp. tritici PST-130]